MLVLPNTQTEESRMTSEAFIIDLLCRVDDALADIPKHPQSAFVPRELVALAFLFAI